MSVPRYLWIKSFRVILVIGAAFALTYFFPSSSFAASSCAKIIPPGGAYDILRNSDKEELHEYLEERMYTKNYGNHDEAIADGFSVGFVVYNMPLKVGGQFDKNIKDAWFDEYRHRKTQKTDYYKAGSTEIMTLNTKVVKDVTDCIVKTEGLGLIGELTQTGGCTATFGAWYRSTLNDSQPVTVADPPLIVHGGTCDPWLSSVIGNAMQQVFCRRSGRELLSVTLNTLNAGSIEDHIEAMPNLGPEPTGHDLYADAQTKPATKDFTLFHSNFTFWNGPGTDLGEYQMTFYSDLGAPDGGKATSADFISCSGCGAHFWLCPNGGICPHPLFEVIEPPSGFFAFFTNFISPSNSYIRVWAYRNSDLPPIELKLRLNYFSKENKCVKDCGQDLARKQWEAVNAESCPILTATGTLAQPKR